MKALIITLLAIGMYTTAYSQVNIELFPINVESKPEGKVSGKGGPPPWAPAHGYRANQRYYFFPDMGIYFDISKNGYWHLTGVSWVFSVNTPHNFDPYREYKTQIDFTGDSPYLYINNHRGKYKNPNKGGGKSPQNKKGNSNKGKGGSNKGNGGGNKGKGH